MKVSMTRDEVLKAVEYYATEVYRLRPTPDSMAMSSYGSDFCTFEADISSALPHCDEMPK